MTFTSQKRRPTTPATATKRSYHVKRRRFPTLAETFFLYPGYYSDLSYRNPHLDHFRLAVIQYSSFLLRIKPLFQTADECSPCPTPNCPIFSSVFPHMSGTALTDPYPKAFSPQSASPIPPASFSIYTLSSGRS